MANVNVVVEELSPSGLASQSGFKLGLLRASTKAAQNDTLTITNAREVQSAFLQIASSGVAEANTVSANVITLTSATGGTTIKGLVLYR